MTEEGRPKLDIDWKIVDEYLKAQCSGTTIAAVLGCHEDTLYLRCKKEKGMTFSAYSQLKKAEGRDCLLKKQFEKAEKGDVTMLIWLGKQYLDQKEKVEHEHNVDEIKVSVKLIDGKNTEHTNQRNGTIPEAERE